MHAIHESPSFGSCSADWGAFANVWNAIVDDLRETDLVSNKERGHLSFHFFGEKEKYEVRPPDVCEAPHAACDLHGLHDWHTRHVHQARNEIRVRLLTCIGCRALAFAHPAALDIQP